MAFRSLTQHYVIDPAQITEEKIEESKRNAADLLPALHRGIPTRSPCPGMRLVSPRIGTEI